MLLVLDVGNTNTVLGVFAKAAKDGAASPHYEHIVANWRVATIATQTVDNMACSSAIFLPWKKLR